MLIRVDRHSIASHRFGTTNHPVHLKTRESSNVSDIDDNTKFDAYHVVPIPSTKGRLTWSHVIKAKTSVKVLQIIVREQCKSIGDLGILHPLNITFEENTADAHSLVFGSNSERVDADSAANILVTHRLLFVWKRRFVGGTAISMVTLAFDKHPQLDIIEADGYYTQKYTTDHIQIDSGQRFSALFQTKTQAELESLGATQFWVVFETRESDSVQRAYAILNYQTTIQKKSSLDVRDRPNYTWAPVQFPTASSAVPKPTQSNVNQQTPSNATLKYNGIPYIPMNTPIRVPYSENWLEYTLVNLPQPGYLQPISSAEVTRRITIGWTQLAGKNDSGRTIYLGSLPGQSPGVDQGYSWFEDAPSGPSHPTPYLVDIYKYGQAAAPDYQRALANEGVDPVLDAWPAQVGEVLEIVWQNEASDTGIYGVHPMHAHGGPYFDIGSGSGTYDPVANNAKLAQLGWQGSLRDTTLLYAPAATGTPYAVNGWRAWRVRVTETNVGVWMIHCHILQHIVMGQQTVWVFGDADQIVKGSDGTQNLLQGYFTYGGDVVGSEGGHSRSRLEPKWPTVAHFFD